ncbi:MAG: hypothetical protein ACLTFJ_13635 [Clostridium sp.]
MKVRNVDAYYVPSSDFTILNMEDYFKCRAFFCPASQVPRGPW